VEERDMKTGKVRKRSITYDRRHQPEAIGNLITKNGVAVKVDYWEKKLNADTLNNIKNNTEGTTYILGRANVGGGIGEHWVVIEAHTVGKDGTITYTVNGTSDFDTGRTYTSGPSADDRSGTIN